MFVVIFIVLLVSIFLGAPVACSIGFTGPVALLIFMEPNCLKQFGSIAYNQGTNMNQLVAPLLILMAEFLARGGTLGIMIPPSITFVTYGILTETSIAKLLMAGLLPASCSRRSSSSCSAQCIPALPHRRSLPASARW